MILRPALVVTAMTNRGALGVVTGASARNEALSPGPRGPPSPSVRMEALSPGPRGPPSPSARTEALSSGPRGPGALPVPL